MFRLFDWLLVVLCKLTDHTMETSKQGSKQASKQAVSEEQEAGSNKQCPLVKEVGNSGGY